VTLVPPTALEPYDLLRHEHVVLSREAVAKLSRSLSATRPEVPVQIEPASAPAKKAASEKGAEAKAPAKAAAAKTEKSAKKPAAKKEAKAKAKPKGKKG
jgi:hypothetical protein